MSQKPRRPDLWSEVEQMTLLDIDDEAPTSLGTKTGSSTRPLGAGAAGDAARCSVIVAAMADGKNDVLSAKVVGQGEVCSRLNAESCVISDPGID